MKLLKKQWLTVVLLATLILTLSLGVFFLMPSRTAKADEDVFVAEKEFTVTTGDDLNAKIKEAGPTPTRIILDDDIVLTTSEVWIERGQSIAIDLKGHTLSRNSNWVIVNMWGNLYLEDSSAEKTGTIAAATDAYFAALVWNYGKVVSNVNYDIKYSTCVSGQK